MIFASVFIEMADQSYFILFAVIFATAFFHERECSHRHRSSNHTRQGHGKIVGGYSTDIENVPYQVYLLLRKGNDYYQCGGSIINEKNVLTAAHCLSGIQSIYMRAGSTDSEEGGNMYQSSIFMSHPKYNSRSNDYDFGIIKFNNIKIDGERTKAIKLPSEESSVAPGTEILVSGWGATSESGSTSRHLMAVKVPTVSNEECRRSYGNTITSRMLCAGNPKGGKDSCQGDSGGPAVTDGTQVGIVSFGVGCARPGYPGVYSNIAAVRSWIKLNTGV